MDPKTCNHKELNKCCSITAWIALALSALLCLFPNVSLAADPTLALGVSDKFAHMPLKGTTLPEPGQAVLLTATLNGSRDLKGQMHLYLVSDGSLTDVPVKRLYLNENDFATFEFDITAPWIELAYQFIFQGSDGNTQVSPRYAVKRSCLPSVDLTKVGISQGDSQELGTLEKMQKMVEDAKGLERDLGFYNHIISNLEKLSSEVPQ